VTSAPLETKGNFVRSLARRASLLFPQRFLKDMSLQTTSSYVSTALQLARGIVLARLLGPASLGLLATVGVVMAYLSYADLGMGRVPLREIPLAVGAGRGEQAEEWRFYGVVAKTACATIAALGLAGYVLLNWQTLGADLRFGLLTACVVLVASALTAEQQVIMQADQRFGRLMTLLVVTAAVNLLGGVAGAVIAGVRGVFVSQLVAFAFSAGLSVWLAGLPRRAHIRAAFLRRLVRAGIPFALIAFVGYNLINIDQVMIASLLGSEALGIYMLVLYAASALALFPNALAGAVGTRLLLRFGKDPTTTAIGGLTWRPVAALSVVMPVLTALAWAVGPWVIVWLLPAYESAIGPLRVYVVGAFFLGINVGTSTVLFALNKHRYYIPIVAGCIGLNVVLDLAFVSWQHWGLIGIALGSACTYTAFWMVHTTLIRHFFGYGVVRSLALNLSNGWPGLALAAADIAAWATGNLWGPAYWFGSLLITVFVGIVVVRRRSLGTWTKEPSA
jgi:O-antigen/teichoic acid export membrane protein